MKTPRINRDLAEMIKRLERQVTILKEFSHNAFVERRPDYCPEVATKLRVLLVRSRANTPLLLEAANQLQYPLLITLGGPPFKSFRGEPTAGDTITLDSFFDMHAVTIQTVTGLVSLTKREVIRAWCEQLGGAHEDWSVDESLLNALRLPVVINDWQPLEIELSNCARTAIGGGEAVIKAGRERLTNA